MMASTRRRFLVSLPFAAIAWGECVAARKRRRVRAEKCRPLGKPPGNKTPCCPGLVEFDGICVPQPPPSPTPEPPTVIVITVPGGTTPCLIGMTHRQCCVRAVRRACRKQIDAAVCRRRGRNQCKEMYPL